MSHRAIRGCTAGMLLAATVLLAVSCSLEKESLLVPLPDADGSAPSPAEPGKPPSGPGGEPPQGLVGGLVVDPWDRPLEGVRMTMTGPGLRAQSLLTRDDGSFWFAAPADTSRIVLRASDDGLAGVVGAWYDFASDTLRAAAAADLRLVLVPNLRLSESCGDYYAGDGPPDDGGFLRFFKIVSRTLPPVRWQLFHWAHYPLLYWVEDDTSTMGYALQPHAREAAAAWNERTGFPLFAETADSAGADLVVELAPISFMGVTTVTDPKRSYLGWVEVRRAQIKVNYTLRALDYFRGIVLHELGHAAGCYAHSECNLGEMPHVMAPGAGDVPGWRPMREAISDEEALAARLVVILPQGFDTRVYLPE